MEAAPAGGYNNRTFIGLKIDASISTIAGLEWPRAPNTTSAFRVLSEYYLRAVELCNLEILENGGESDHF